MSQRRKKLKEACQVWPWVKIQIVPPVNIPLPTKIGSKMGGEFTYQPECDSIGFDNHSRISSASWRRRTCCHRLPRQICAAWSNHLLDVFFALLMTFGALEDSFVDLMFGVCVCSKGVFVVFSCLLVVKLASPTRTIGLICPPAEA